MGLVLARVNVLVGRYEWAGWTVLVLAALMVPWVGIEAPIGHESGVGMLWLDATVTAALWAAFAAQVTRILNVEPEHVTIRAAAWLLLLALGLICGRLAWLLAAFGDVRMTASMAVALLCLSASVLLHSVGRVVYGGGCHARDTAMAPGVAHALGSGGERRRALRRAADGHASRDP